MRVYFSILLVIFSQVSFSLPHNPSTVGLASEARLSEFRAYLKAHPQHTSLAEKNYRQSLKADISDALFEAFKRAQYIFFSDSKKKALEAFIGVLTFIEKADWKPPQRKILFTSALRAAELSDSDIERQNYLTVALKVSVVEKPDPKVFPPPLIQKFESLKKVSLKTVPIPEALKDAEIISVAGQVLRTFKNRQLKFPNTMTKVVAYSSKWKTVQALLDSKDFKIWNPYKESIFLGTCFDINTQSLISQKVTQVYANRNCVIGLSGKNILTPSPRHPIHLQVASGSPTPSTFNINHTTVSAPKKTPWWKNKWLWIGVASAGAAYMIYENNQSSSGSDSHPTTVYE